MLSLDNTAGLRTHARLLYIYRVMLTGAQAPTTPKCVSPVLPVGKPKQYAKIQ